VAVSLRSARRAASRMAERLRWIEDQLQTLQAGLSLPEWPSEEDYDESMARDPAVALAHDIEHVIVAYLQPAIATLDRAATEPQEPATPPHVPLA
jgi:hypothetical protein